MPHAYENKTVSLLSHNDTVQIAQTVGTTTAKTSRRTKLPKYSKKFRRFKHFLGETQSRPE